MMRSSKLVVLVCLCVFGCATDGNLFVLVPDQEGHVGEIAVTNEAGTSTLSGAQEGVRVADASTAPREPEAVSDEEIQETFGDALAAEPPKPVGYNIYFGSGSAELEAASLELVTEIVEEAKRRDSRDISLNGHTDSTGDPEYNMKLSMQRAQNVRELLVERGIKEEYLSVGYHGEGNPLVKTPDGVEEPRNRRVEVIVR